MLFDKRDLARLIIPLIIEQTLALSVGMFDTVMVTSAGEAAVSGVALVENINSLLLNLLTAFATGGAIVAGQYLGRRDRENGSRAAKQLVLAIFFFALVIMAVCLALNGTILSTVFGNVDGDVMGSARAYFYITALSYPFIALFNASAALFRGMGNSKVAMVNGLIMNGLNIGGNAIFIYGCGWGAFGAGLATTLSRMIAAITMMWMLRNPELDISVRSYHPRDFSPAMIKRILRIAVPNGLENSVFHIGRILITGLVSVYGTAAIAAHAVAASLSGLLVIPGQSIALALTTVVAQCVGAGQYDQANQYMKSMMKAACLAMVALNLPMLLALRPILGLYQLSGEAMELAWRMDAIHAAAGMFLWPFSFALPNAFRAAGDVKFPMFVSLITMWVFRIGCSYLMAYVFGLGVLSVWYAMVIDWLARTVCYIWRWRSGGWKKGAVV